MMRQSRRIEEFDEDDDDDAGSDAFGGRGGGGASNNSMSESSRGGGGARRRDAFGMPSDDEDDEDDEDGGSSIGGGGARSAGSSSQGPSGIGDDEDEFSTLANNERLFQPNDRGRGAPQSRQAQPPFINRRIDPLATPRFSAAPPPGGGGGPGARQPDFLDRGGGGGGGQAPRDDGFVGPTTPASLDDQKLELLHKIQRMAASGTSPQISLSIDSPFEQIQLEYQRMKRGAEITRSIKFQRRVLLAVSTGVEFVSKRASFLKLRLDGFSESVLDSIADYDEAFEGVHEKYGESVSMDPMYSVMFMFMSSMVAYHISNAMFSTVLPSVSQTLSNNPAILARVAEAMQSINGNGGGVSSPPPQAQQQPPQQPVLMAAPPPVIVRPAQQPPPMIASHFPPPAPQQQSSVFGLGPDPPLATRPEPPGVMAPPPTAAAAQDEDDVRSVSASEVSAGGTRRRASNQRRRAPPGDETLIL
jgi:hypothetical protein